MSSCGHRRASTRSTRRPRPAARRAARRAGLRRRHPARADAEWTSCGASWPTAPAEVVVANHCYGLFELAAVYLSQTPPLLSPRPRWPSTPWPPWSTAWASAWARPRPPLHEALAQVRLAYVQIATADDAAGGRGRGRGPAASRVTGPRRRRGPG